MTPAPGDPGGSGGLGGPREFDAGGASGDYEVVVHHGRRHVWVARARVAGRGGRTGLARLRAYLRTPEGRHAAARTARAVGAAAAVVGAVVLVRGRLQSLARGAGAVGAGLRAAAEAVRAVTRTARAAAGAAAGAVGAAVRATRLAAPLRWLASVVAWMTRAAGGGPRRRVRCPDCHARVRGDAHVCYRCGYRPAVGGRRSADARGAASRSRDHSATLATTARRRGAASGSARLVWRLLALRLYAACPDCRRPMHADARVCAHCGYRLIR